MHATCRAATMICMGLVPLRRGPVAGLDATAFTTRATRPGDVLFPATSIRSISIVVLGPKPNAVNAVYACVLLHWYLRLDVLL
eukprot:1636325-Pleurochrysis_carterae.AAC.1